MPKKENVTVSHDSEENVSVVYQFFCACFSQLTFKEYRFFVVHVATVRINVHCHPKRLYSITVCIKTAVGKKLAHSNV